jgi:hypothetical protein
MTGLDKYDLVVNVIIHVTLNSREGPEENTRRQIPSVVSAVERAAQVWRRGCKASKCGIEFLAHTMRNKQDEYSCKPLKAITALVI